METCSLHKYPGHTAGLHFQVHLALAGFSDRVLAVEYDQDWRVPLWGPAHKNSSSLQALSSPSSSSPNWTESTPRNQRGHKVEGYGNLNNCMEQIPPSPALTKAAKDWNEREINFPCIEPSQFWGLFPYECALTNIMTLNGFSESEFPKNFFHLLF